ncbi:MAG: hypothetical protein DMG07_10760 [Acidobacteria bacterium]|nr:MAG: hypothetical protein DMG07_10760 [Acidobacteriota bacterium]
MRYMLLIHDDESILHKMSPQEMEKLMADYGRFTEEVKASGAHKDAARLRPVNTATTVRVRSGKTLTTDGPFAETKEQLGGYYLIDVKNLDEAIQWAAKIPSAKLGCVEVRPVWDRTVIGGR